MNKKLEVYNCLYDLCNNQIKMNKDFGVTAEELSDQLKSDRANISRILNTLHKEGLVIKNSSRPIFWFAREPFEKVFEDSSIPDTIPNDKNIYMYLNKSPIPYYVNPIHSDPFESFLYNDKSSSMFKPVRQAKAALNYPAESLSILIHGEYNVGKSAFAKSMFEYGKAINRYSNKSNIHYLDCLSFKFNDDIEFLKVLFGYSKNGIIEKGMIAQSKNSMLVIDHLEQLSTNLLQQVHQTIYKKSFSPMFEPTKIIDIKCTIVGLSSIQHPLNEIVGNIFPINIYLTSISEKNISEILVIVLKQIQSESDNINKSIKVSKNVLSCFVMSQYKGNSEQLKEEITQSCTYAYWRCKQNNSFYAEITYEDISDDVLTNIYNINDRLDELHNILNLFNEDFIYFSPKQENKELKLLYDLNNPHNFKTNELKNSDNEILLTCINDINKATNAKLNSIRSIQVKNIYDDIYPIIQDSFLKVSENLQYGLFFHLQNVITDVKSNRILVDPSTQKYNVGNEEEYILAKKILDKLECSNKIQFPQSEMEYVATYLYLSKQQISKSYIQILIISIDSNIAEEYSLYLNSKKYKTTAHFLTLSSKNTPEAHNDALTKKILEIDKGKGVLITTITSDIPIQIEKIKANLKNIALALIKNVSIQSLISLMEKAENLSISIKTLEDMHQSYESKEIIMNSREENKFLSKIVDNLLADSLQFLDAHKISEYLYDVLLQIISDLKITHSNELLVKFLFHSSFMIERCIRKEPFEYKKAKSVINQNSTLYYTIYKNMQLIKDIFSITIPDSEIAMIMEIFIPHL